MDSKLNVSVSETALREAEGWFHILRSGSETLQDHEDFLTWLTASDENLFAHEQVDQIWQRIGVADEALRDRLSEMDSSKRGATIIRFPGALTRWETPLRSLAIAASLLIAVAVSFYVVTGNAPTGQAYQTAAEQRHKIVLEDGSNVHLNARTRLQTAFTEDVRHVDLFEGEAYFEVTSNKMKLFVVRASSRTIRVVGTEFNVRLDDAALIVAVVKGTVEVDDHTVPKGYQLVLADGDTKGTIKAFDPSSVLAWRDGKIILDNVTLAEAVVEFNRYYEKQIVVMDSSLRELTLSGVFNRSDHEYVIAVLERLLPLRAAKDPGGDILLVRRSNGDTSH